MGLVRKAFSLATQPFGCSRTRLKFGGFFYDITEQSRVLLCRWCPAKVRARRLELPRPRLPKGTYAAQYLPAYPTTPPPARGRRAPARAAAPFPLFVVPLSGGNGTVVTPEARLLTVGFPGTPGHLHARQRKKPGFFLRFRPKAVQRTQLWQTLVTAGNMMGRSVISGTGWK